MQADAEHQQHHADLGEFVAEMGIGHEARGEGAEDDAGQQVADQGRQPEAGGEDTQHQGQAERSGQGGDQGKAMRHGDAPCRSRRGNGRAYGLLGYAGR
ncbi:hypothetical protein ACFS3C_04785 [Azotobacter vinelandii]